MSKELSALQIRLQATTPWWLSLALSRLSGLSGWADRGRPHCSSNCGPGRSCSGRSRHSLTPVAPVGPIRRLDEIEGIGAVLSARLVRNGIADPAALVSTDPARLAQILRVTVNQAKTFIDRARRLLG